MRRAGEQLGLARITAVMPGILSQQDIVESDRLARVSEKDAGLGIEFEVFARWHEAHDRCARAREGISVLPPHPKR
jgi:hypothetical protein